MKNLDNIAEELFNKIRGRFPKITIGTAESVVTNDPKEARFFDFELKNGEKVNISLDDEAVTVMYNNKLFDDNEDSAREAWYDFLKELRQFSRKRMLNFDTRDITKSNLDKRDYEYLAKERGGETTMSESKMYGTSRTSFQDIGNARMIVKHSEPVNQELASGRSQKIHSIYVENSEGERFKYPFKHLNGARAVARHVSEGGNPYDDIGQHIVGLSEELNKLRKFKTYMNRSTVMAEGLSGYMDVVYDRINTVKKTIESLQKESSYKQFVETFEVKEVTEVPEDIQSDWIDQLTIRQFNEELKGVFPYIYKLVSEANAVQELGPEDIVDESGLQYYTGVKKHGKEYMKKAAQAGRDGASQEELGRLKDKYSKAEKKTKEEFELEQAFEDAMGQFADSVCEECGNPSWRTLDEEKQKGVDGKVCWKGYKRMGTKMKGGKRVDNCVKVKEGEYDGKSREELLKMKAKAEADIKNMQSSGDGPQHKFYDETQMMMAQQHLDDINNALKKSGQEEGNAYANAVRQAKKDGKKKGDKIQGPDGDEITLEKEQKTPLGEFILSYFDRESGQFPKGETAVLTMIEKDYGEEFIEPAKQFIEQINNKVAEIMGYKESDMQEEDRNLNDADKKVMQKLTGMIKQKQKEMQDARKGGNDEDVRMIASQLEDFYSIAELIQGKRPMGLDTSVMDLVHDMYDEVDEARYDDGGAGVVEKLLQGITKDFVNGDDSAAQKMVDMLKKYNAPMDKVADMLEQKATELTKKTFGIFDNPLKKTPASNAADRMTILADYIRSKTNESSDIEEGSPFDKFKNNIVLYDPDTMEVKKMYPMMHRKQASADAEKFGLIATDGTQYMQLKKDKRDMGNTDLDNPGPKYDKAPEEPKKPGALDRIKSLAGLK